MKIDPRRLVPTLRVGTPSPTLRVVRVYLDPGRPGTPAPKKWFAGRARQTKQNRPRGERIARPVGGIDSDLNNHAQAVTS
jgi:hypothetical protein